MAYISDMSGVFMIGLVSNFKGQMCVCVCVGRFHEYICVRRCVCT